MAISLTHKLVAVGVEAGNGEVEREAWNDEHALTLATNTLIGRQSAGTGDAEEISCTAAGRALIDDASAADQRATLGLGSAATLNTGTAAETLTGTDATLAVSICSV